jgi:hypothetical protein
MSKKRKPLLKELTQEEHDVLLPMLLKLFSSQTNEREHITRERIVDFFNLKKDEIGFKRAFNLQRFMKLTNYIRTQRLAPLCSGNNGYYVSYNKEDVAGTILSLKQRIEAQQAAITGLEEMLVDIKADEVRQAIIDPFGITDWK